MNNETTTPACWTCGLPVTDHGCTADGDSGECKAPRFVDGTGPRFGRPGVLMSPETKETP
jgi:hypothetical protein